MDMHKLTLEEVIEKIARETVYSEELAGQIIAIVGDHEIVNEFFLFVLESSQHRVHPHEVALKILSKIDDMNKAGIKAAEAAERLKKIVQFFDGHQIKLTDENLRLILTGKFNKN
jgi:RAB protein geranylgeranyltransferase component A